MVKTGQKTNYDARGLERLCTTLVSIQELITSRSSLLNSPNKQKPEDAVRCIAYLGVITLQVTTQSLNRQASTTIDRGRSSLKNIQIVCCMIRKFVHLNFKFSNFQKNRRTTRRKVPASIMPLHNQGALTKSISLVMDAGN